MVLGDSVSLRSVHNIGKNVVCANKWHLILDTVNTFNQIERNFIWRYYALVGVAVVVVVVVVVVTVVSYIS